MNNGLVITIKLLGRINGSVRHTETQTIRTSTTVKGKKQFENVKILHTDRGNQECVQKINISPEVVDFWTSNSNPFWVNTRDWKRMNKNQRIESYVARFDEGYGVSFELV